MALPTQVTFWSDEDKQYVSVFPEFNLSALADTEWDAICEARKVWDLYVESL